MKVAILSLRFAPGHIAHLRAYRELFQNLDCEVCLFLDKRYSGYIHNMDEVIYIENNDQVFKWNPDMVFSYNIANSNIRVAKKCRKMRIPFYYVLHEPWDSFKELISLRSRMPRRIAANIVNYLTSHYAYKVILASDNGAIKYRKYMKRCNKSFAVFPLIFCDDYDIGLVCERKYISFIGGFTVMRGCKEFLEFVRFSISKRLDNKFCIATRNNIDGYINDPVFQNAIDDGTLVVFAGRPMTSDEINLHYREAICSWNAYKSSTQSGVLPNALMQGSPVLVTDRGDSADIVTDRREGCFIGLPHDNIIIYEAVEYIKSHKENMSEAARDCFRAKYYYKIFFNRAREVYEIK